MDGASAGCLARRKRRMRYTPESNSSRARAGGHGRRQVATLESMLERVLIASRWLLAPFFWAWRSASSSC